jgi:hypothetical protein
MTDDRKLGSCAGPLEPPHTVEVLDQRRRAVATVHVVVAKQDVPPFLGFPVAGRLDRSPVGQPHPVLRAPEHVRAGIGGVAQRKQDVVVRGRLPHELRPPRAWPDHRQLEIGVAEPQQHLTGAAEFRELAKDALQRRHDPLVGIELDLPGVGPALAGG